MTEIGQLQEEVQLRAAVEARIACLEDAHANTITMAEEHGARLSLLEDTVNHKFFHIGDEEDEAQRFADMHEIFSSQVLLHLSNSARCVGSWHRFVFLAGAPLWKILAAGEWRSPAFLEYMDIHRLENDVVVQVCPSLPVAHEASV